MCLPISGHIRCAGIPYGTDPRQSLDVYMPTPAATNRPIVVFWYGGMWIRGSKEQYRFVGAALANAGYVAILPDYRLFPQARFPDFIEDGARAVKWAHEHATELGGDPQALFLMGHSAGRSRRLRGEATRHRRAGGMPHLRETHAFRYRRCFLATPAHGSAYIGRRNALHRSHDGRRRSG